MKFTDRQVLNLKPRSERFEVWGTRGLGLRVSPSGRKTWVFMYRYQGRPRRMSLGAYPEVSVAKAHKLHGTALVDLERGVDPGAVAVDKRRDLRQAESVKELCREYVRRYAKPNKRSWREDEWMLEREIIPGWGNRKAQEITRRDVVRLLDAIVERPAPILANRVFACIRKMFAWAVSRDMIPGSPCLYIPRPSPEQTRDRILNVDELTKLWEALQGAPASDRSRYIVQLVLLTAQRPGEVLGMRWEEIDRSARVWTIPAERTKNGKPHAVPFTGIVGGLIDELSALAPGSPWVIPSPARSKHPLQVAAARKWIEAFREAAGIEKFRPHDLRRSAATGMAELGVSRFVVGRVLNHSDAGDVTGVYDRHDYLPQMRDALERWAERLEGLGGKA